MLIVGGPTGTCTHDGGRLHPEQQGRIFSVMEGVRDLHLEDEIEFVDPPKADRRSGPGALDPVPDRTRSLLQCRAEATSIPTRTPNRTPSVRPDGPPEPALKPSLRSNVEAMGSHLFRCDHQVTMPSETAPWGSACSTTSPSARRR